MTTSIYKIIVGSKVNLHFKSEEKRKSSIVQKNMVPLSDECLFGYDIGYISALPFHSFLFFFFRSDPESFCLKTNVEHFVIKRVGISVSRWQTAAKFECCFLKSDR